MLRKVDYVTIADRAMEIVGSYSGDYETRLSLCRTALEVMQTEEVDPIQIPGYRAGRLTLLQELGFAPGQAAMSAIRAAIQADPNVTDDTETFLLQQLDGEGLDLTNSDVVTLLMAWGDVNLGGLTPGIVQSVLGLSYQTAYRFPGLKVGHIYNALEWRLEGKI